MEEVPLLNALRTAYATRMVLIGISIDDSVGQTDRTIKEKGMTYPILADGKGFDGPIPTAYHIQGTPSVFVLDRDGKLLARLGSAKEIEAVLKDAVR
jgi:peroxiredoxin